MPIAQSQRIPIYHIQAVVTKKSKAQNKKQSTNVEKNFQKQNMVNVQKQQHIEKVPRHI
jgi:hypothetical protein